MFKYLFATILLFSVLSGFIENIKGCGVYQTASEVQQRRKRQVEYNARNLENTEELRRYFRNCLSVLEPNTTYDWATNVDYTVLDTVWFDDNALVYCGFGQAAVECWRENLATFVRADSRIFPSVQQCILFFGIDFATNPPDFSRFPVVNSKRKKRFIPESPRLDSYSRCLNDSTVTMTDIREELNFATLAEFFDLYAVNSSCFALTNRIRDVNTPVTWPRRIVSFTRVDSPLRLSLQDCGETFFPTIFPDRPLGFWGQWENWSQCSTSCGSGNRRRERSCFYDEESGDIADPFDCDCTEPFEECMQQQEVCNTSPCEPPVWGPWIRLSTCTASCSEGFQVEIRRCFRGSVRVSFKLCEGVHTRIMACNFPPCPRINKFIYESWSSWSSCTVTCSSLQNQGVQRRMRCPRGFPNCTVGDQDQRRCINIAACQ